MIVIAEIVWQIAWQIAWRIALQVVLVISNFFQLILALNQAPPSFTGKRSKRKLYFDWNFKFRRLPHVSIGGCSDYTVYSVDTVSTVDIVDNSLYYRLCSLSRFEMRDLSD